MGRAGDILNSTAGRIFISIFVFALDFLFIWLKRKLPPYGLFLFESCIFLSFAWGFVFRRRMGPRLFAALSAVLGCSFLIRFLPSYAVVPVAVLTLIPLSLWLDFKGSFFMLLAVLFGFSSLMDFLGIAAGYSPQLWDYVNVFAVGTVFLLLLNIERKRSILLDRELRKIKGEMASLGVRSRRARDFYMDGKGRDERLSGILREEGDEIYRILSMLNSALNPHACLLYMVTSDGEELYLRDGFCDSGDLRTSGVSCGEGIFGAVLKGNAPVYLRGVSDDASYLAYYKRGCRGISSAAAVPVPGPVPRGVLVVDFSEDVDLNDEEREVLTVAAEQVAHVLDTSAELGALVDLRFELEQFYRAGSELSRHLKLDDILDVTLKSLCNISGADMGAVVLRGKDGKNRIERAVGGWVEEIEGSTFGQRVEHGLCSWVIRNSLPLDYRDFYAKKKQIVLFSRRIYQPSDMRSLIVLPLRNRDGAFGCVVLISTVSEMGIDEQKMAEAICNHAAVIIQNGLMYEKVEKLAATDGLTGLFNHRTFQEKLDRELASAVRYGHSVSLLMMDIDHFKSFNDRFGHPVGDFVLKSIAGVISEDLRSIDIAARYGGEEFALILPQTDIEGALATAERIRKGVEKRTFHFEDLSLNVTLSIGVASYPAHALTKDELIDRADRALYFAKRSGRNRCVEWRAVSSDNFSVLSPLISDES